MDPSSGLSGIHHSVRAQYSEGTEYEKVSTLYQSECLLYKVYDISSIVLATKQEEYDPLVEVTHIRTYRSDDMYQLVPSKFQITLGQCC